MMSVEAKPAAAPEARRSNSDSVILLGSEQANCSKARNLTPTSGIAFMMLAVLPWNSPVMPELRKMIASAPLVQLAAAWEELHPAICMVFRRSKGAVAVRETTPASAPLTKTAVADPPEPSLSLNADIAVGFSDSVRPTPPHRSAVSQAVSGARSDKGRKSLDRDTNRQNSTNKPQEPNRFTDIERKCRKVKPNKPDLSRHSVSLLILQ